MKKHVLRNEAASSMRRMDDREQILDGKSILIGLAIVTLLFVAAAAWRLAVAPERKQTKLREFEFKIDPPKTEKIDVKDPQRDLMKPLVPETPEMREDYRTEMTILSSSPKEVQFNDAAARASAVDVVAEVDVRMNKMDISDTLEKADEAGEEIVEALNPMAVLVGEPGDIYAHAEEPEPSRRRKVGLISTSPRSAVGARISTQELGNLTALSIGELSPVDMGLLGDDDYLGAMKRGGMEIRTAAELALQWLATHQDSDGSWSPSKWNADDVPYESTLDSESGSNPQEAERIASTAFSVIALMGGGNNLRRGEHRKSVVRGLEWLMFQQDKRTGYISRNMYAHAIATIALCEAVGRSPDEHVGPAARKAVDACVAGVARDGGWRYVPNAPDSDSSVASWFLQALKTAKLANIKFDQAVFSRGLMFIDQCTDKSGLEGSSGAVGYSAGKVLDEAPEEQRRNNVGSPPLTCAGMVIRQFNGMGVKHPLLVAGANLTRNRPPDWDREKDFYYWYYATYAMHNMGGEYRLWWNRRIRDTLLDHQSKRGHQSGSWNPIKDRWLHSRVLTTAVGALCLEVYDRYGEALQSFGTVPSVEELFFRK